MADRCHDVNNELGSLLGRKTIIITLNPKTLNPIRPKNEDHAFLSQLSDLSVGMSGATKPKNVQDARP